MQVLLPNSSNPDENNKSEKEKNGNFNKLNIEFNRNNSDSYSEHFNRFEIKNKFFFQQNENKIFSDNNFNNFQNSILSLEKKMQQSIIDKNNNNAQNLIKNSFLAPSNFYNFVKTPKYLNDLILSLNKMFNPRGFETENDSNRPYLCVLNSFSKFTNKFENFQKIHMNMIDYFNYIYVNLSNELMINN